MQPDTLHPSLNQDIFRTFKVDNAGRITLPPLLSSNPEVGFDRLTVLAEAAETMIQQKKPADENVELIEKENRTPIETPKIPSTLKRPHTGDEKRKIKKSKLTVSTYQISILPIALKIALPNIAPLPQKRDIYAFENYKYDQFSIGKVKETFPHVFASEINTQLKKRLAVWANKRLSHIQAKLSVENSKKIESIRSLINSGRYDLQLLQDIFPVLMHCYSHDGKKSMQETADLLFELPYLKNLGILQDFDCYQRKYKNSEQVKEHFPFVVATDINLALKEHVLKWVIKKLNTVKVHTDTEQHKRIETIVSLLQDNQYKITHLQKLFSILTQCFSNEIEMKTTANHIVTILKEPTPNITTAPIEIPVNSDNKVSKESLPGPTSISLSIS